MRITTNAILRNYRSNLGTSMANLNTSRNKVMTGRQFVSSAEKCRNAEIFVDGRTIEVYLNDGEDVGTRLFYNSNRQGIFCLNSEKDAQVKICEMKSIWK